MEIPKDVIVKGSRGPAIKPLQRFLRDQELSCSHQIAVDGVFGPVIELCLTEYQKVGGIEIEVPGGLDLATREHMLDLYDFYFEGEAENTDPDGVTTFILCDGEEVEWSPGDGDEEDAEI